MQQINGSTLKPADARDAYQSLGTSQPGTLADSWAAFQKLSLDQQARLDELVLANELDLAGLSHNVDKTNYASGYAAIGTLFSGSIIDSTSGKPVNAGNAPPSTGATHFALGKIGPGDISLVYSQVLTNSKGDINLFAPGGRVDVGLANSPPGVQTKLPSQLGILTASSGSIIGVTAGDFNVNASRVFTAGGGDISLWSSFGNIDAGRGAKSLVLVPPPDVSSDSNGNPIIKLSGATNGSGIGALLTGPGQTPGNVSLIAPTGTVDAGDAGIRAAGNLNIAAVQVLNAANIQVGGTATGVPAIEPVTVAAPAPTSNSSQAAGQSSDDATRRMADAARTNDQLQNAFKPTIVTVDVLGIDDDSSSEPQGRKASPKN